MGLFGRKKRGGDRYADENYDRYADDGYVDDGYIEDGYADDGYAEDGFAGEYDQGGYDEPAGDAPRTGPYDFDDVADLLENVVDQRLDLGSVILPVPPGAQLQVEMTPQGAPQAVHLATEHGRITVAAYAAPKSPGQWRTVAADLADSLRKDGAQVSVETGPWGRELHAVTANADLRFIGVDGYRWMVRLVAAGPHGAAADGLPLVAAARAIMSETVVRRGSDPLPVRDPLPVVLPPQLAEQLAAAHQAQIQAQQQAAAPQQQPVPPPQPVPQQPRRNTGGSAMQQLGLN
ncbi:MAG TPA: DUF3710 domain-containing protein [Nocardia sp.]|uniref:DUF3710 domain-containing protein n=1 Tax=Nocardia sp. TaxID=1821 RepID=UPI002B4AC83A|nr:DUF3710 domain-containing protein [Nocardia sp.]HLS76630.1 DUF3710 domain-containing protein [Nocardia sp.]